MGVIESVFPRRRPSSCNLDEGKPEFFSPVTLNRPDRGFSSTVATSDPDGVATTCREPACACGALSTPRSLADDWRAKAVVRLGPKGLRSVTSKKLGSQATASARILRLPKIAPLLVPMRSADRLQSWPNWPAQRMVGEFPELQGPMGRYYALAAGRPRTWLMSPATTTPLVRLMQCRLRQCRAWHWPTRSRLTGFWALMRSYRVKDPHARGARLGGIRLPVDNAITLTTPHLKTGCTFLEVERIIFRIFSRLLLSTEPARKNNHPLEMLDQHQRLKAYITAA